MVKNSDFYNTLSSSQKHGGCGDYFLLEHYLPESSITSDCEAPLIAELQARHRERKGVLPERAEDLFIVFCQQLAEYGTHFYSAQLYVLISHSMSPYLKVCPTSISGDRIVSVNGQDLLSVKYKKALLIIQRGGSVLDLVLSQPPPGMESPSLPPRRPRSVCADYFQSHLEQAYLRSIRYETAPDEDHMESGELPSLSSPQSGMGSTGRSLSNGELTSLPPLQGKDMNEVFHATQSFII
ncbi:uncharacterized protein LOC113466237 [Diaphorina citri]|uniref:Uncharacterized protein LOC113466237 n=1 Tax=Diaphorina citri TaxID=121845 RepID=A0A3Q0ILW4_DIACI|nr:uncharacterized protein LOC113466237 [Diaphorina citri]